MHRIRNYGVNNIYKKAFYIFLCQFIPTKQIQIRIYIQA